MPWGKPPFSRSPDQASSPTTTRDTNPQISRMEEIPELCSSDGRGMGAWPKSNTSFLSGDQDTVLLDSNNIPVRITYRATKESTNTRNTVNHGVIKRVPYRKSYDIPTVLSANVRTIASKVDEIQQIAELNNANAICITETWLSPNVSDPAVSIPGYNLFRKDRTNKTGGGVCIYLNNRIPCRRLDHCDEEGVESLWISMRPQCLPRNITSIILSVIYHTTSNREPENVILRQHIQRNLDNLLAKQPNALVLITGDFNPTSTGLKSKDLTQANHLKQLVTFKTRDSGILDWFLTNRPKLFELFQLPKIALSDHYTILAKPILGHEKKQVTKKIITRDMRESAWRAFGRWMTQKDWNPVLNTSSCEDKFQLFITELKQGIDRYLPQRTVKVHQTDRPWMTKKLKIWIRKRQTAFLKHGKSSSMYKYWRNKIQREIKSSKSYYYTHKVADLGHTNPRKWWKQIKSLMGQDIQPEWYYQFLGDNRNAKVLADKINSFFLSITENFSSLSSPSPIQHVPQEFLVSEAEVYRSLSSIQVSKSVGPDEIPNRLLKEFAPEISLVIQDIYNQSMREGYIPELLKSSIVSPITKVSPPKSIESDLRPISLTCTLAKIMEGFLCKRLQSQLTGKIDPRQFACKGHSTTDALIYMLQPIYEAIDSGNAEARIFFADFTKGFDLIDHNILMQELIKLNIHPALLNWITAFLTNRKQAVRIGGTLSDWKSPNGGIPQGTKLGVILFSVMTNNLISDWHLRTKYVDDTSALEIIPRNSISYLNTTVDEIHQFSINHNMKLNPLKCKEMVINFMHNVNFILRPLVIGSNVVERVNNYKLLGVQLSEDLKWNKHVEYIYKKACKKLYSLRVLRRAGVEQKNILKVYLTTIRPVLEYAVPIWQAIPDYLSKKIESIQRRAFRIILPLTKS